MGTWPLLANHVSTYICLCTHTVSHPNQHRQNSAFTSIHERHKAPTSRTSTDGRWPDHSPPWLTRTKSMSRTDRCTCTLFISPLAGYGYLGWSVAAPRPWRSSSIWSRVLKVSACCSCKHTDLFSLLKDYCVLQFAGIHLNAEQPAQRMVRNRI